MWCVMKSVIIFIFFIFLFVIRRFIFSLPELCYWWVKDLKNFDKNKFNLFGLIMYTGPQGSGKTIGMVKDLEDYRIKYPKCKIYTNFGYEHQTGPLTSLNDLIDEKFKNGENGVIFAIDEIQNEFSCSNSKDFPETLLSEVTQQRKQKVCILTTSQNFTRVAKPLREQCFTVVKCSTLFGRYTMLKYYNAELYNNYIDNPTQANKKMLIRKYYQSFVQTDYLRSLYDTYEKIKRLSRAGFVSKIVDNSNQTNNVIIRKK